MLDPTETKKNGQATMLATLQHGVASTLHTSVLAEVQTAW